MPLGQKRSEDFAERYIQQASAAIMQLVEMQESILEAANMMISTLTSGNCIFWMGNGGSASDAQHLAAELVGRFQRERPALKSLALTTDTSVLTAVGNDFGFDRVFSRQIEALCRPGDLVIGISTSGRSENVVRGLQEAHRVGARTILLTGAQVNPHSCAPDLILEAPSTTTCHIQECHIVIGQLLCGLVEENFSWPN